MTNGTTSAKASAEENSVQQGRFSKETLEAAVAKRAQHSAVERYLAALEDADQTKSLDRESLETRMKVINDEINSAGSRVRRVELLQERLNLEKHLARMSGEDSFEDIEMEFVRVASDWATRKGITYEALRLSGVSAAVLKRAGIARKP